MDHGLVWARWWSLTGYTKSIVNDAEDHAKHHHIVGSVESPKFDAHEQSQANCGDHQESQADAHSQKDGIPGLGVDLRWSTEYPAHIEQSCKGEIEWGNKKISSHPWHCFVYSCVMGDFAKDHSTSPGKYLQGWISPICTLLVSSGKIKKKSLARGKKLKKKNPSYGSSPR